jgi:excisionase family DNA binding protein
MTARSTGEGAQTYLLESAELAEVVDLVAELEARGVQVPQVPPALVGADGHRIELPHPVFEALRQVVNAMSRGQGVTIAPQNALLTTQEGADFLGISRPTLVRLLEDGEIAHEMRGRHRRVTLADLVAYQQHTRHERRETLATMAREGQENGLYAATDGPPRRTR